MVWEKALEDIQRSVDEKGYFLWSDSFKKFDKKYNLGVPGAAPAYLSLDFYSQQRPELSERGLYVIRLGLGNFGIFDEKVYPKPYLELNEANLKQIELKKRTDFENMRSAFRIVDGSLSSAEDTLIELCRFQGVFKSILGAIGEDSYEVGPRGFYSSSFPLFFKKKSGGLLELSYEGQIELDYSIWTHDRVLVFEAKSLSSGGLDIGWHKLAFPAQRFSGMGDGLKINPVYFLRKRDSGGNRILVYLFPELRFVRGGVVLNDESNWMPLGVWSIGVDDLV